ncbi:UDP-glucuronosyltransferase 1-7C-like [Strongylocentrotus purpuratus]|uniref:UDP-glucuronosyltransferase n=1 Tax=Strongylocentrotus purpuratus TaxID=7668 RepID=A0A7M7SUW8_STRPU|nr:UDP-glucuronosyltransferase 1-7C-like [Strongylocentrotus purpuratus]
MAFKNGHLLLTIIFIFGTTFSSCNGANVLIVGFYMGGSHMMAMIPIGRSLVSRGHQVTFLISDIYTGKYSKPEYTDYFKFEYYHCPNLDQDIAKVNDEMGDLALEDNQYSQLSVLISWFTDISPRVCDAIFSDVELMKRFDAVDAVVIDVSWPCGIFIKSFLSKQRNTPIRGIVVSPSSTNPYIQQLAGSPINPSYQPFSVSGLSVPMSFLERVSNVLGYLFGNSISYFMFSRPFHRIVDKYDLDPGMKNSIHEHIDIYLINTEFAVESPYSLTPNIIPVGGLTARPAGPLGEELESFMQSSAEHGVIVFSLGSNFSVITKTRPDVVHHFVEAFGRLPHKVLFHLHGDPPERLPENIKMLSWLPLKDVLGHPMTRLFVYHGGNNGFLEGIYHGVPMVIMPLIGDQIDNAVKVETLGLGTTLNKNRLSADIIHQKLAETLQDPECSKRVKRASAIFKDRPMTAPDRAAFWIEHVVKHGGSYMRSPVHDLSFVQYHLIDVILLLIFILTTILYLSYKLIKCCICRCVSSCEKEKNKRD